MEDKDNKTAVIVKNGKSIQVNLDKVWTLWIMSGGLISAIITVVIWVLSINRFETESESDRIELRQMTLMNQEMLIELNFNIRNHLDKDDTGFTWKDYSEIRKMLKLR